MSSFRSPQVCVRRANRLVTLGDSSQRKKEGKKYIKQHITTGQHNPIKHTLQCIPSEICNLFIKYKNNLLLTSENGTISLISHIKLNKFCIAIFLGTEDCEMARVVKHAGLCYSQVNIINFNH
jgi:hypothetical protein